MEFWCEPVLDGFVLHYFLHAEPTGDSAGADVSGLNHHYRVIGKRVTFEIKDLLESGRAPGDPAISESVAS